MPKILNWVLKIAGEISLTMENNEILFNKNKHVKIRSCIIAVEIIYRPVVKLPTGLISDTF